MRQGSRVTELLREARDGNVEALGDALTAFRSRLTRFAVKYLGTRKVSPVTSPSELVQNMELIATRHFPDFRGSTTAEWWRWLRRILLRIMIRAARPTGLDRRWVPIESVVGELTDCRPTPAGEAMSNERNEQIRRAVDSLPTTDQEILFLRLRGLKFHEIGETLQITQDAARMRFNRAVERLDVELKRGGTTL